MIEPLGLLLATLAGPLRSQRSPGLASAASTGTGDPNLILVRPETVLVWHRQDGACSGAGGPAAVWDGRA